MTDINNAAPNEIKELLYKTFIDHFTAYSNFIKNLPIPPQLGQIKQEILVNIDVSFMWGEQLFRVIEFPVPPKLAPVPPTEVPNIDGTPDAA